MNALHQAPPTTSMRLNLRQEMIKFFRQSSVSRGCVAAMTLDSSGPEMDPDALTLAKFSGDDDCESK